jgi:hypothetical protein
VEPELAAGRRVEPHEAFSQSRFVLLHRNEHDTGCAICGWTAVS